MVSGIEFVVRRLADEVNQYPFLRECFGPDVILVPVPRSAPLRQKDALWPTLKICTAMYKAGLGGEVAPILIRRTAVQKSATAGHGERPNPQTHFASTAADGALPLLAKGKITIVDDFITRGSTFIGMYPHITGRYSGQRVFCFALIRTISSGEVESWKSPVQGRIIFNPSTDYLHREP